MMGNYARVVRRSAALCSVVAVAMIAICAGVAGAKGLYGALVGIGVVTAFFAISILAVGRAAKVSPMVMMGVAMATYQGLLMARRITGEKPDNPFEGIPFRGAPLGLYNGNPWFLPLAGAYYKFLDWVS